MDLKNYVPLKNFNWQPEKTAAEISSQFATSMSTRRSIRNYSSKEVDDTIIRNAILAASSSPSGANQQPWFFGVIKNKPLQSTLRKEAEKCEKSFYEQQADTTFKSALEPLGTDHDKPYLETASHLIVVFCQQKIPQEDGSFAPVYYGIKSTSIAVGLMISSLHLSGVATLTHTPATMSFLNDILDVPRYYRPQFIVVAGYPEEPVKVPAISRKPFQDICKFY